MKTLGTITIGVGLLLSLINCSASLIGDAPVDQSASSSEPLELGGVPTSGTAISGDSSEISIAGGTPPFTVELLDGEGSVSMSGERTLVFVANSFVGQVIILVTDANGESSSINVFSLGQPEYWFDAADVNGNGDSNSGLINGDPIDLWRDKTGNHTLSASGAARPNYLASDFAGRPSIGFDPSVDSRCMVLDSAVPGGDLSVFAVAKSNSGSQQSILADIGVELDDGYSLGGSANSLYAAFITDGMIDMITSLPSQQDGTYRIFGITFDLSEGQLNIGGGGSADIATVPGYNPMTYADGTFPTVGAARNDCSIDPLDGAIVELIYWSEFLPDPVEVACHYQSKYGLSGFNCPN